MKKYIVLFSTLLFVLQLDAQQELNRYKYIIIPDSYDFTEGKDRYQLNSLTKFMFNREGFEAFLASDSIPQDVFENRCKALYADVEKLTGGMFKTLMQIHLKDCYGKLVYSSEVGSSKQKEFGKAYTQAIRNAFESFETFEYTYQPNSTPTTKQNGSINDAQTKAGVAQIEKSGEAKTVSYEVNSVEYTETPKSNIAVQYKDPNTKSQATNTETKSLADEAIYYAQSTEFGYRLVDSEPKLIMELVRTAQQNTYSVKGKDAIVFQEAGFWYYSEMVEGKTVKTLLNIRFYD